MIKFMGTRTTKKGGVTDQCKRGPGPHILQASIVFTTPPLPHSNLRYQLSNHINPKVKIRFKFITHNELNDVP